MISKESYDRARELLADMSVKEKIGQMLFINGARENELDFIEQAWPGTVGNVNTVEDVNAMQKRVMAAQPHHIPAIISLDVIQGYRTIFPIPLAEAATFDPSLAERDSYLMCKEAKANGCSWTCAPMVDIARDPRWGRIAEGNGEDVYLDGVMGAARVKGITAAGIASCAKHYVAYGNAEGGRDYNTAQVNENELRNVYLPPFHECVKAGVTAVMPSFNTVFGVPMTGNKYLLKDILRGEFGFKGVIATDYNAIDEMVNHGVAEDRYDAGVMAAQATVDMDMGSNIFISDLEKMLENGDITEEDIDAGALRVLALKYEIGLMDCAEYDVEEAHAMLLNKEAVDAAKEAASRVPVLLKNENNVLPFSKEEKILVTGPFADDGDAPLGWWRAFGDPKDSVSLLEGMKGISGNIEYIKGLDIEEDKTEPDYSALDSAAAGCDKIIAVLGEPAFMSGESHSRGDLTLPGLQTAFIKHLASLGKPLVTVVISGRPHDISAETSLSDAVLYAWEFGSRGDGVAEVIYGIKDTEARLPVSIPVNVGQIPIYYSHENTGRPYKGGNIEMTKSVKSIATDFTSYYIDMPCEPLFPFGHGLSYTSYEYSDIKTDKTEYDIGEHVTVSVKVKNTGDRKGRETVQFYVKDVAASTARPVRELKSFVKVDLEPGEEKTVVTKLGVSAFSFYGIDNKYILEPGKFIIFAGHDSKAEDSAEIVFKK